MRTPSEPAMTAVWASPMRQAVLDHAGDVIETPGRRATPDRRSAERGVEEIQCPPSVTKAWPSSVRSQQQPARRSRPGRGRGLDRPLVAAPKPKRHHLHQKAGSAQAHRHPFRFHRQSRSRGRRQRRRSFRAAARHRRPSSGSGLGQSRRRRRSVRSSCGVSSSAGERDAQPLGVHAASSSTSARRSRRDRRERARPQASTKWLRGEPDAEPERMPGRTTPTARAAAARFWASTSIAIGAVHSRLQGGAYLAPVRRGIIVICPRWWPVAALPLRTPAGSEHG